MDLDVQVAKLKMLKANHTAQQYEMQDKALKYYPQKIAETKLFIEALSKDLPVVQAHPVKDETRDLVYGPDLHGAERSGRGHY